MSKKNKKIKKQKKQSVIRLSFIDRYFFLISILLITVSGIIAYSNTYNCSFQFDDVHHIIQNPNATDLNVYKDLSFWFNFTSRAPASFTLALNRHFGGLDVFGYHVVNLIIHLLSALALFFLVGMILRTLKDKDVIYKNRKFIQLSTALIFILHPIQTESVTYIVQRMESMSGFFYLVSLIFYMKFRLSDKKISRRIMQIVLFVLFAALAVMTKQSAYSLPLSILLIEIFFIKNMKGYINKKIVIPLSVILLLSLIIGLIFDLLPREINAETSRYEYMLSQFLVIPKYLRLMLLPYGQNLDHHILIPAGFSDPGVILGLLLISFIIIFGVYMYKKGYKLISFTIFWFYALISLRSSVLPISDLIYEHRLYIAIGSFSIFLSVLIVYFKEFFLKKYSLKYFNYSILLILSILFCSLTYQRNKVWRTELSLWDDAVRKSPGKFRTNYNYAEAVKKINPDRALYFYHKAYNIKQNSYGLCNNVGNIYADKKNYKNAQKFYEAALRLKPDYSKAKNNLANVYIKTKNYVKAESLYLEIIKTGDEILNPTLNLGHLYYMTGKYKDAVRKYEQVLSMDPGNKAARKNLEILRNAKLKE